MIVKLEENISQKEIEVLIKYAKMNNMVKRLESLISSIDKSIKCSSDNNEIWLNASDILYIESIDKHTFIYSANAVYNSKSRLYQLSAELSDLGFIQVSKSCILNINALSSIRSLMNSRMEATLTNGERINITRKFVSAIREKLQEG